MKKIKAFIMESYGELKKVVWPSRDSVMASAKVVIVSTVAFALFFGLVDFLLSQGLLALFRLV
jgi:preprotein translocase subunit SecE